MTSRALRARVKRHVEIVCGADGASAVASLPGADAVIAAIVGAAGIPPVYAALKAGKRVGIANKEVLVAAGDVMTRAAREHGGEILPVDSEHNAVHQALRCGGARRGAADHPHGLGRAVSAARPRHLRRHHHRRRARPSDLEDGEQDLHRLGHDDEQGPRGDRGASPLRRCRPIGIDILIHPQSIVHSMVEYVDGSIIAQLSTTDMKFPIQYALLYPERVAAPFARLDLAKIRTLDFSAVDPQRFPAVELAYAACRAGGSMPAVLNAANEIAVERFLAGELPFTGIVEMVSRVLDRHAGSVAPIDYRRGRAALGRLGPQ